MYKAVLTDGLKKYVRSRNNQKYHIDFCVIIYHVVVAYLCILVHTIMQIFTAYNDKTQD
jgi:hypothetical protein